MTPPVRPSWTDTQHPTLADALKAAKVYAAEANLPIVVGLRVEEQTLQFSIMLKATWEVVGQISSLAAVAVVQPDGTRSLDPALSPDRIVI